MQNERRPDVIVVGLPMGSSYEEINIDLVMKRRDILQVDVESKSSKGITMEIILIIFKFVEDFLHRMVFLQSLSVRAVPSMGVRILCEEQKRLHVLQVGSRTRCIFLKYKMPYQVVVHAHA